MKSLERDGKKQTSNLAKVLDVLKELITGYWTEEKECSADYKFWEGIMSCCVDMYG